MSHDAKMRRMLAMVAAGLQDCDLYVEFEWHEDGGPNAPAGALIYLNGEYIDCVEEDGLTPLNFLQAVLDRLDEEVFATDYGD